MQVFILLLLITSGFCVVMTTAPSLAWVSSLAWGVTLLLGGNRVDRSRLAIIAGLNVLLLFGLSGNSNLFLVMTLGLPSFLMGSLLGQGQGYYQLQKWGILSALLLAGVYLGLAYIAPGATAGNQAALESYVADSISYAQESGIIDFYVQQGYSREELQSELERAARWMFLLLPAFHAIEAMLGIWLVIGLAAAFSRYKGWPILGHKPFREEIMPWQLSWFVILALSLWLLGRNQMTSIYYWGANLLLIALPVTAYYGLANLVFQIDRWRPANRKWGWLIFMVSFLVFTPVVIIFTSLLGLFDSLVDYRKLNRMKEGT